MFLHTLSLTDIFEFRFCGFVTFAKQWLGTQRPQVVYACCSVYDGFGGMEMDLRCFSGSGVLFVCQQTRRYQIPRSSVQRLFLCHI